jgi:two-component system phosphate regulon sensor histidine kinase PhoR
MLLIGTDAIGRPISQAVDKAELRPLFDDARKKGSSVAELDLPGIKPRRVLVHASKLLGPRAGEVAVFFDVTEVRRLESLRRDFVANVSHELRTPLARLRLTTSGALQQESDPAELREALQIADRAGVSMTRLVDQLLALARLDQKSDLSTDSCFVREFLEEAQGILKPLTPGLEVSIQSNARVRGSSSDLARAVINLVDNARRHSPPEAPIRVSTSLKGDSAIVSVRDSGEGIEQEHLQRLGERFYRADEHRSRKDGGAGLGLSIAKAIVERSGGTLRIESVVGSGTTVELILPIFSQLDESNKSQTSVS